MDKICQAPGPLLPTGQNEEVPAQSQARPPHPYCPLDTRPPILASAFSSWGPITHPTHGDSAQGHVVSLRSPVGEARGPTAEAGPTPRPKSLPRAGPASGKAPGRPQF